MRAKIKLQAEVRRGSQRTGVMLETAASKYGKFTSRVEVRNAVKRDVEKRPKTAPVTKKSLSEPQKAAKKAKKVRQRQRKALRTLRTTTQVAQAAVKAKRALKEAGQVSEVDAWIQVPVPPRKKLRDRYAEWARRVNNPSAAVSTRARLPSWPAYKRKLADEERLDAKTAMMSSSLPFDQWVARYADPPPIVESPAERRRR